MKCVVITGWLEGFQKISMTKLIRAYTGSGLAEGKRCTDDIVEMKRVFLRELTGEQAERFVEEARRLGAICHVQATEAILAVRG